MLALPQAIEKVLAAVSPLPSERVMLARAVGSVAAEDVAAERDLPPADNSAMDGYAVRAADLGSASVRRPVRLRVIEDIAAGRLPRRGVGAREASRIMTGAILPAGADAVIPVEQTRSGRVWVTVRSTVAPGSNVRRRAEDLKAGATVLARGAVLGPAEIGLLAAVGRADIQVVRSPRVGVLATGDELVEAAARPGPHQIRNSNSPALEAAITLAGAIPIGLGVARDTPAALEERIRAARQLDALIITGGVSVGAYDFVKPVLRRLGMRLQFWRVAMRPGRPFAFGLLERRPVFGLPGNPVSALVTFDQLVRPALRKMSGHTRLFRPVIEAVLADEIRKPAGLVQFVRVRLRRSGAGWSAHLTGPQGSHLLTSLTAADGLLIAPARRSRLRRGTLVKVELIDRGAAGIETPAS